MKPIFSQGTESALAKELFDRSPIGMAVTSADNVFVGVNSAFSRFLGYSKQELLSQTVRDVTHPDDWKESSRRIRRMQSGGPFIRRFEKRYLHKSGKTLWGDVSVSIISGERGTPRYSIAQVVDITERKQAEEALRLSNERFRVALAASPTMVFSQDRELRYTWIHNPSPCFKIEDVLGKRETDLVNTHDARKLMRIKSEVMKTGVGHRDEITINLPIGETVFDTTIEPLRDARGKVVGVICAATDITGHKRMEEALAKANDELEQRVKLRTDRLRKMTEELTRAEHRERRRIADILHEHLQQHLCAMKFQASELKERSSEPATLDLANRLVKGLDQAIHETRTLSADLHPQVLTHLGLKAGIEWLATDVMKKLGLAVEASIDKRFRTASDEMQMFVFDAVRELLLNVVKHAKVKKTEVRLSSAAKEFVRIQVRDAGVGFDTRQNKEPNTHFGLFRIQERAESLGGRCEVISQPGKGTCVSIILPRSEKANAGKGPL